MGVISTQGIKFQLVANDTILDLFKDEDIKLSNNVTGLFDLGLIPADFTRQITLPGSKKNNDFFEHVYDISVLSPDTFATNVKVPCYISYNGLYLAQGYLQLNKVTLFENKFIDSYEVTIYGTISSFSRDVNRTFLTDMTGSLSAYNFTSSFTAISSSWNGELFGGDVVFPMADYGQKLAFTTDVYTGIDSPYTGMGVQDYKPAIRIKKVWDAIFQQYGYTYSSSFWQQSWLDNVYIVANNKLKYPIFEEEDLETYGIFKVGPVTGSANNVLTTGNAIPLPFYNTLSNPGGNIGQYVDWTIDYPTSARGIINLNLKLTNTGAGYGYPYFYLKVVDFNTNVTQSTTTLAKINQYFAQLSAQWASQGLKTPTETFEVAEEFYTAVLPAGTYRFWLEYNWDLYNNFTVTLDPNPDLKSYLQVTKLPQLGNGWVLNMGANMPFGTRGIKQLDFITAIQKKFNLVMYPSLTVKNEFIVETFNDWYNKGVRWDFNRYINIDKPIDVIPANNFAVNELNFGDLLDGDYISQQFAKGANREYGKTYYVDTDNFFSQGKFEVKSSFASSPLIYLTGTGVSGSATGGTPIATPVNGDGLAQLATRPNPYDICSQYYSPVRIVYSTTGLIEESAVLYFDAYGNDKVVGYNYVVDNGDGDGCKIYELDAITGIVGTWTGNRCSSYGGCV
jgi:hypothetical protein